VAAPAEKDDVLSIFDKEVVKVTQTTNPIPAATSTGGLTDGLAKWEAEARSAPAGLEEVRLDLNERLLVPFTTSVGQADTHYVDYPSLRGYVRCGGPGCLLCRVGRQKETRDLLPVYDVLARAVAVLPVSPNLRPHALKPQLMDVLRKLKDSQRVLVAVRKLDRARYHVAILPLPEGADDGAAKIAAFLELFSAGGVDLADVYPKVSNDDLAAVPEIAAHLRARGITP
jgi:hypothetical protein